MSGIRPPSVPDVLGRLPDIAVIEHLGHGVQSGRALPPQVALRKSSTSLPDTDPRWLTAPIRELLDQTMSRFGDTRTASDGWLAPRLHATLRMTRAEAADGSVWNFLAMLVAPDYVVWRWHGKELAATARFNGPHHTQAFARLWWTAELFRDGPDYRPVEAACRYQDLLNTTLRLDVIDHRPTAQAILTVIAGLREAGATAIADRTNALSAAVNAAGSTLLYDILAPDPPRDPQSLRDWIADVESASAVHGTHLPDGPDDGSVPSASVQALLPLFEKLLTEAPLRRRTKRGAAGQEDVESVGISLRRASDHPTKADVQDA